MSTQHNYYLSSSVQNPKLVARSVPTHTQTHTHWYAHNRRWQAHRRHIVNRKGKCNEWRRRDTRRSERRLWCIQRNPNATKTRSYNWTPESTPAHHPHPPPLAGCVWALRQRRLFQCWQNSLERTDWELEPLRDWTSLVVVAMCLTWRQTHIQDLEMSSGVYYVYWAAFRSR